MATEYSTAASSMHLIHGTSLLSTPLPLWNSIATSGKKNDDEKTLLLKIIWLYCVTYNYCSSFYFFLFYFADNFELNAQVPAAFPFSTCQRHFEATLLDFPHLCLQRDTIHCCNGLPERKGKNFFFLFSSRGYP